MKWVACVLIGWGIAILLARLTFWWQKRRWKRLEQERRMIDGLAEIIGAMVRGKSDADQSDKQ